MGKSVIDVCVLKKRRKSLKLTQEELAKKVGVSRQAINKIERRREMPSIVVLAKMLKVLDLKFEDVIQ